jgi:hypothetical protein
MGDGVLVENVLGPRNKEINSDTFNKKVRRTRLFLCCVVKIAPIKLTFDGYLASPISFPTVYGMIRFC